MEGKYLKIVNEKPHNVAGYPFIYRLLSKYFIQ